MKHTRNNDKTAFVKTDKGKSRPDLIPGDFLLMLGDVFRYRAAALRHLAAYCGGEELDPESGLPHIGHCAASLAMLWGLLEQRESPLEYAVERAISADNKIMRAYNTLREIRDSATEDDLRYGIDEVIKGLGSPPK